jgi:hypothetical protein
MKTETISEKIKEKVQPAPAEFRALKSLKEEFGSYFKPKELEKISQNSDSLYFSLPSIFNKLDKEGKWEKMEKLQKLSLEILIKERRPEEKKTFEFPPEKPPFLKQLREFPKSLKAPFLALGMLTIGAIALEVGHSVTKKRPQETKTGEMGETKEVAKGTAICSENMCRLVVKEKNLEEKKADLKQLLEGIKKQLESKLSPEEKALSKEILKHNYDFLFNKLSGQEKNDSEVQSLISQIEAQFKISQ